MPRFGCAWPAQAATPVPFGLPVQYRNAQAYPVEPGVRDISLASTAEAHLAEQERTLGPYHPDLVTTLIGGAAAEAGDYELAATLYASFTTLE